MQSEESSWVVSFPGNSMLLDEPYRELARAKERVTGYLNRYPDERVHLYRLVAEYSAVASVSTSTRIFSTRNAGLAIRGDE